MKTLLRPPPLLAILTVTAALVPAIWLWGFTVDDAWIPIRYARHLATGDGYRFNALSFGGASTDGVTPLPWPWILAPFAHADAELVLMRAKYIGLGAWLAAAAALGGAVSRADASRWAKGGALVGLAVCVPLAAHAVSGMETGLVIALATVASVSQGRPRVACMLAGLAASLRPEMLPWALALAIGVVSAPAEPRRGRLLGVGLAVAPFAACALLRLAFFGRVAPLSVFAKPSDIEHGLVYAGAAALASVGPLFACAPVALWRAPRHALTLALAGAVHLLAVVAVGGDWMPYARLTAPIVPSLMYAFVLSAPFASRASFVGRAALGIALGLYVAVRAAPAGRHVMEDRARLIERARPLLLGARSVAALDIGWASAATEARIIDLAGLTDPAIAMLPGGHTSKRIDAAMLLESDPDVLLLYRTNGRFERVVEARLADSPLVQKHFAPAEFLPLGASGSGYVVMRRR